MRLDGKELLRTEDICLTFHPEDGIPVKAADHVSITIHEGETFGLVGESGSGKSTLARILTHIHQPDSGKVYFEGKDVTNLKGKHSVRAAAPSRWSSRIHPLLSIRRNASRISSASRS